MFIGNYYATFWIVIEYTIYCTYKTQIKTKIPTPDRMYSGWSYVVFKSCRNYQVFSECYVEWIFFLTILQFLLSCTYLYVQGFSAVPFTFLWSRRYRLAVGTATFLWSRRYRQAVGTACFTFLWSRRCQQAVGTAPFTFLWSRRYRQVVGTAWGRWRVEGCWRRTWACQCFSRSWTGELPRWNKQYMWNFQYLYLIYLKKRAACSDICLYIYG